MTRNVVVVVLDTVRKDYFDQHATRLRSTADTSFEQCRAASSWSAPSHTSMFTGTLPHQHGVHAERFDGSFDFSMIDTDETFLGKLSGHTAVGLSANSYINSHFGVDVFFDEFHDFSIGSHTAESLFADGITVQEYMKSTDESNPLKRYAGFLSACLNHDRVVKSVANGIWAKAGPRIKASALPLPEFVDDGAGVITDRAVDIADRIDEPSIFFMNYMDAHTPLRNLIQHDRSRHSVPNSWSSTQIDKWELNKDGLATDEYTENYRAVYAAAIDYLDRTVADLIRRMEGAFDRETSFVITADHGHNLGYEADNGLFHHTGSMTEGVMHTPLEIVNPPAGFPTREPRLFSQLDLGDLVVALGTGQSYPDVFRERIPAETIGLLGGDNATWGRDFSPEEYEWWNRMIRCVYEGTTKRQWNSLGDRLAFDLDPDRPSWQAQRELGIQIPSTDRALFDEDIKSVKASVAATDQDEAFDESVESHLKELGYL